MELICLVALFTWDDSAARFMISAQRCKTLHLLVYYQLILVGCMHEARVILHRISWELMNSPIVKFRERPMQICFLTEFATKIQFRQLYLPETVIMIGSTSTDNNA